MNFEVKKNLFSNRVNDEVENYIFSTLLFYQGEKLSVILVSFATRHNYQFRTSLPNVQCWNFDSKYIFRESLLTGKTSYKRLYSVPSGNSLVY